MILLHVSGGFATSIQLFCYNDDSAIAFNDSTKLSTYPLQLTDYSDTSMQWFCYNYQMILLQVSNESATSIQWFCYNHPMILLQVSGDSATIIWWFCSIYRIILLHVSGNSTTSIRWFCRKYPIILLYASAMIIRWFGYNYSVSLLHFDDSDTSILFCYTYPMILLQVSSNSATSTCTRINDSAMIKSAGTLIHLHLLFWMLAIRLWVASSILIIM